MFRKILLISLVLLMSASVALAGQTVLRALKVTSKTIPPPTDTVAFQAVDSDGYTVYKWDYAGEYRQVNLPILGFMNSGMRPIDQATTPQTTQISPNLVSLAKATPGMHYLLWDKCYSVPEGATYPAAIQFRVPDDYASSPQIVLEVSHDEATSNWGYPQTVGDYGTGVNIAWQYYKTDSSVATTARAQVSLATIRDDTFGQAVTLSMNYTDLAAGDVVTFEVWPDRNCVDDGTPALRLYNAAFRYRATY